MKGYVISLLRHSNRIMELWKKNIKGYKKNYYIFNNYNFLYLSIHVRNSVCSYGYFLQNVTDGNFREKINEKNRRKTLY